MAERSVAVDPRRGKRAPPSLWARAAVEFLHGREAASRISFRGGRKSSNGRASTSSIGITGGTGPWGERLTVQREGTVGSFPYHRGARFGTGVSTHVTAQPAHEAQIRDLEAMDGGVDARASQLQLGLAQQQYGKLLLDEAKMAWRATQSRIYQWGNKSSKLLHRLCLNVN
ncbi:hypothetical protein NDU88_001685 [Pleurodeles waltl]|uniref:Uncharacterized protein n=1 Tax=Pleurodeles waltl TaxID=8319 RepID=A0AAV7V8I0_PLEWA|nr:hypothetical protein NDU88_001685 [Pleurodeles waltl]